MASTLKDKIIAITGGAGGIGLQLALLLAEHGAKLSLCDNQKNALEAAQSELESKHNATVLTAHVDVRDTRQVNDWIEKTVQQFGRLDGAANLAGIIRASGNVSTIEEDAWDFIMDVNVKGLMKCLRAEMAVMEKNGYNGSIVNAGSISSLRGTGMYSAYCTSKHAVLGLTRAAAQEGAATGIRVNAICPSLIDTKMVWDESKRIGMEMQMPNAMNRRGTADEVAKAIVFLLSDASSFVTGAVQDVTGGSYP